MNAKEYLETMQKIQQTLTEFIEQEDSSREVDSKFNDIFNNLSNDEKPAIFKETLLMISQISQYHHRTKSITENIEKILLFYEDEIKRTFSNKEIFNIFKNDKKNLLFLFNKNIITIDKSISNYLSRYGDFFAFEIEGLTGQKKEKDEEFERKRQIGENDSAICQIIREDLIDDFIVYTNQSNLPLNSKIQRSTFETHSFLNEKSVTLIEYSAFFGSLQIFKYLLINNVDIKSSLLLCAIHGKNQEIIHTIEELFIHESDFSLSFECFYEAIKCHHNDVANYFKENHITQLYQNYLINIIQYHNYIYFPDLDSFFKSIYSYENDVNFMEILEKLIQNNYVTIVKKLLNEYKIQPKWYEGRPVEQYFPVVRNDIKTLLSIAVENENIEIVDYLIKEKNATVNTYVRKVLGQSDYYIDETIMFIAVHSGNAEIVKLLLQKKSIEKANPNQRRYEKDRYDYFLIDFYVEKIEEGLQNDKLIYVFENKTELAEAVENEYIEIVGLLLEKEIIGINKINKSQKSMWLCEDETFDFYEEQKTPLSIAVEKGNKEIVELLLTNIITDVNIQLMKKDVDVDAYRETDSMNHYRYNSHKCNESQWTKYYTALDIAKEKNNNEIYEILKNHIC